MDLKVGSVDREVAVVVGIAPQPSHSGKTPAGTAVRVEMDEFGRSRLLGAARSFPRETP